jgi:hypothetical protein
MAYETRLGPSWVNSAIMPTRKTARTSMPGYSMSSPVRLRRFFSCSLGSWVKTTSDSPRSGSSSKSRSTPACSS